LRLVAAHVAEVAQAVVETALHAIGRVVDIDVVEVGAVVAGQGDTAVQVVVVPAEQAIDDALQRYDAQPQVVDQAQIRGEGDMIVARVIVSSDVVGMIGEDRNAHDRRAVTQSAGEV